MLEGQSRVEHPPARFRAPSDQTRPADGNPPRRALDFAAHLNHGLKIQAAISFDPQTAAAEIH
jgi:hypothetical protein